MSLDADDDRVAVRHAVLVVEDRVGAEGRGLVGETTPAQIRAESGLKVKIPEVETECFGEPEFDTGFRGQIGECVGTAADVMHERGVPDYGQSPGSLLFGLNRSHSLGRNRLRAFPEDTGKLVGAFRNDVLFVMLGHKGYPFGIVGRIGGHLFEHGEKRFFGADRGPIHRGPTGFLGKAGNVSSRCCRVHNVPP